MVKHIEDYPTMHDDPWDYPHKGELAGRSREIPQTNARRLGTKR